MKIVHEYRQRCFVHGGVLVSGLIGDMGGAAWMMMKTRNYIRRRFYDEKQDDDQAPKVRVTGNGSRRGGSNGNVETKSKKKDDPYYKPLPDHSPKLCEACLMNRCPLPSSK